MTTPSNKPKRVVIWHREETCKHESPLLLSAIQRDGKGKIVKGWVENGGWTLRVVGDEMQAKDGTYIVNRWQGKITREVPIPNGKQGDYNDLIWWAEKQVKKQRLRRKK